MKEDKEKEILTALYDVKDPEIPSVSLVDLGLITNINVLSNEHVEVKMIPTFSGCPALRVMKDEVRERIELLGYKQVDVEIDPSITWSTNMISEQGLKDIEKIGLSSPQRYCGSLDLENIPKAKCPNCGSEKTAQISSFGPTLCRAVHYCNDCEETFEQFKAI